MQLLRQTPSTIGLDIGTSMIKAVKVSKSKTGYVLEQYAIEPLEDGVIQSGEIRNPSALAQAAKAAIDRCKPMDRHVVVALPNFSILSDIMTMDLKSEKEMREAVLIEAERISPFDMTEVEIDYAVLDRDEEAKKMRVLMVAAKQDIILSFVDFLGEAGLRPTIIDVDLFALANLYHLNYEVEKYPSCILLNIGTESTMAVFLQNGKFHSSRDINVAGINFLRELKTLPDINIAKMHDILSGRISNEIQPEAVTKAINAAAKEFANAVGVGVSYFQSSDNVDKIDLILLAGGYAWIPGICNILELRTGAEVGVLNPFNTIQYDEEIMSEDEAGRIGTSLAVALGLGTRTY